MEWTWYDHLFYFLTKPRFEFSLIGLWGFLILFGWFRKLLNKGYNHLLKKYIGGHRYLLIYGGTCPHYSHREQMEDPMPSKCLRADLRRRYFET